MDRPAEYKNMKRALFATAVVCLAAASATVRATDLVASVANFSQGDLSGWEEKSFREHSQYDFVSALSISEKAISEKPISKKPIPEKNAGDTGVAVQAKVLRATTQGQASGLFKEVDIDLNKTPYLNWSWQVQNLFKGNDERSKQGDDYPARIYVVVSGGLFFWKTKAINYVWSSNQPAGSEWPNAYTDNAKMIAVRAGDAQTGQWVSERRNVREDLQRLFGDDITQIDAVAVMVDGDNTGQSATSYFGDIFFSKK